MANKDGHRRFGNIRKRESGRFQIRYPGPDGRLRTGATTYATKTEADRALTIIEAQMIAGEWTDPDRGKVRLGEYARAWIKERPGLRPKTIENYTWLLDRHIMPTLGGVQVGKITTQIIRAWRSELLEQGTSVSTAAKAYRFLRAVLMTAAEEDKLISRNPCRIKGADNEHTPERPVITVSQVFELADRMADRRFRALILLATFASLRWGEVIALRRHDLDLAARTVRVREQLIELDGGEMRLCPVKSKAGRRTIGIPAAIIPALSEHLASYVRPEEDAFVFLGKNGGFLRGSNFRRAAKWGDALKEMGLTGLHFHDLRHTGNTLAAQSGASLADLKARMGHDSDRAALIYQHATKDADQRIADALSARVEAERTDRRPDG
ncbi:site-specific integrase [Nonomuraea sp. KC401]|uniref:tyrosine-type recombinase/integrase n=1 Tax=unclassified Nonomuraea TaxID=2593643 RepID=UPI0010FEADA4|nr:MULTISPECIES: site-specific integrase [unclassified Nonomuraea]NBE98566.1 tyrosine-type recombinase/integrase [Nonomuraea sp. K271]TLF74230.1 site-specific integrase [Nonomuraea sp. KC401]